MSQQTNHGFVYMIYSYMNVFILFVCDLALIELAFSLEFLVFHWKNSLLDERFRMKTRTKCTVLARLGLLQKNGVNNCQLAAAAAAHAQFQLNKPHQTSQTTRPGQHLNSTRFLFVCTYLGSCMRMDTSSVERPCLELPLTPPRIGVDITVEP